MTFTFGLYFQFVWYFDGTVYSERIESKLSMNEIEGDLSSWKELSKKITNTHKHTQHNGSTRLHACNMSKFIFVNADYFKLLEENKQYMLLILSL